MTRQFSPITHVPFSISLVIPVYNNAATLKKQLLACERIMDKLCETYEIIISNDASRDNTKEVLQKYFNKNPQIKIFNQPKNLGISDNIKFLYNTASYEYIILFSVDGAWNPNDIARMALFADKKKTDILVGKRIKKQYPLSRKIVSLLYNYLVYLLFGVKTYDTGSIKIFKKKIIRQIKLTSKSIFFEGEMIIKAKKAGYTIAYLPIDHYQSYKKSKSGVNLELIFSSFRDLLLLRLQKL